MKIKEYAKINKIPIIKDEGLEFIKSFINEKKIESILEIGTAIGYSALKLADCESVNKVVTLEKDKDLYQIAKQNCKGNNKIKLVLADALIYKTTQKFDLLFIDGAKSQYLNFFNRYFDNVKYVICDNLDFHGLVYNPDLTNNRNTKQLVKKIVKFKHEMLDNPELDCQYFSFGDGLLVVKRKCSVL